MALALHRSEMSGLSSKSTAKRPSMAPEDYESMKLYYKQSYKQNLRQRLMGSVSEESTAAQTSSSERTSASKRGHRQSAVGATRKTTSSASEVRPFTKDMPVRLPAKSPKQLNINLNPHAGNRNLPTSEIAKAAAAALDKRCPRLELPDLYCLHADFRPPEENPDDTAERERQSEVDRKNGATLGRLRKMYQMAIAHSAATSRIAAKAELASGLSPLSFNPYAIGDLVAVGPQRDAASGRRFARSPSYSSFLDSSSDDVLEGYGQHRFGDGDAEPAPSVRPTLAVFSPIEEEPSNIDSQRTKATLERLRLSEAGSPADERLPALTNGARQVDGSVVGGAEAETGVNAPLRPSPLPLDIRETAERSKTLEPKVMSQFWPNYLKVGQSKFAKVDARLA